MADSTNDEIMNRMNDLAKAEGRYLGKVFWEIPPGSETMAKQTGSITVITIHQALKLKNRLAGRLTEADSDLQTYNSVTKDQESEVDVPALWVTRLKLAESLTTLKTAIHRANVEGGLQKMVFQKGEKTSLITLLKGLNTRNGTVRDYSDEPVQYVAYKKKKDVTAEVRQLERELDRLQEEMDQFNHTHKIEVAPEIIELGN
jgi:hypothetical protein